MAAKLAVLAVLLQALSLTCAAIPPETITNAADTLSNSGYVAMSLTLTLISDRLLAEPKSATVFAPPDSSFSISGQPSLSVLRLHFSPLAFSISSLRTLPFGTKIPTLSSGNFLTITTTATPSSSSSDEISINNVKIVGSPIFDDGLLVVFGIENFLDPNFTISGAPSQSPVFDDSRCLNHHITASLGANFSFHDSSAMLVSRGYSVMASFLSLQLLGFLGQPSLTVFAPVDEVMVDYSGRFPDYPSLFLRHVLPCKISWRDLVDIDNTKLDTYLDKFSVNITRSGDTFKVNEVSITFPDMYYSDWLVIHGIPEMLSLPEPARDDGDIEGDYGDEIPAGNSSGSMIALSPDRPEL